MEATCNVLRIGKRLSVAVADLADATREYQRARDRSGEGHSTFPDGKCGAFTISYNGRVWMGKRCVMEADGSPVGSA